MSRLSLIAAAIVVAALSACPAGTPPPPPDGDGGGGGTCDVDGFSITKPKSTDCAANATAPCDLPEREDAAAINRSCIGNPAQLAQSTTVKLSGCVVVFGTGGAAKPGITVGLYDGDQDPHADTPAYGEVVIGTPQEANGLDCGGADAGAPACLSLACEKEGAYVIDDIPLHVPLIMKVSRPNDPSVIDTYTYGLVLDYVENLVDDSGQNVDNVDANLIYDSTYESIPTLAGRIIEGREVIGDGIGRGVIAGEVRDCDNKIVAGASVTSDRLDSQTKVTYFNGSSDDPLPDLARITTNSDGLYVLINAATDASDNVHTLGAGILDPACAVDGVDPSTCSCLGMSQRTVKVFPDSVTIVNFRGDMPVIP